MADRDWQAEIDRWTERFREVADPPEPFATALREGWTAPARARLAEEAAAHAAQQGGLLRELSAGGWDLVRLDLRGEACDVCAKYGGKAFSLAGGTPGLPPPPPMPICPACRHTLNLLTPFFLQSLGLDVDDLVDAAQPYVDG